MGDFVAYPPKVIAPAAGEVTAIRLSNDGMQVFAGLKTGRVNGRLLIYDVSTGNASDELTAPSDVIDAIAINARGEQFVSADQSGSVRVWQRVGQKWQVERVFKLGNGTRWVFFSGHGELAACVLEHSLDVWDVATGTKLRSLPTGADWSVKNGAFDMSRRRIVAGYLNERAARVGWVLWNFDTGERLHQVDMPELGGTYASDIDLREADNRMAIGFDEALLVYDLTDFQRIRLTGYDSTKAVAFSRTHPYLAALNIRGSLSLWNSAMNRPIAMLQQPAPKVSRNCLSFSDDGGRLAVSSADSIQIWDLNQADEKTVMTGHRGGIPCAAFQPNGRMLVTGGKDNEVRFWDASTGQLTNSRVLDEAIQTLAFTADGGLLAAGCTGKEGQLHLRLIDPQSMKIVFETDPGIGELSSLAWADTSNGRYLAGCGARGVALWKVTGYTHNFGKGISSGGQLVPGNGPRPRGSVHGLGAG